MDVKIYLAAIAFFTSPLIHICLTDTQLNRHLEMALYLGVTGHCKGCGRLSRTDWGRGRHLRGDAEPNG